jgi:glucokinase
LGAGQGLQSFLYVTVGTGISASLVIGGRPYCGARGLTGTLATSSVSFAAADGSVVTGLPLEQFAAGPAIVRRYNESHGGGSLSTAEIIELCEAGDVRARQVVESAGFALGAAIAQLVNMLDAAAILLGGGLGLVEGTYRRCVTEALRQHVWSEYHRDVPVVSARLGVDAGFIGAALAAADLPSAQSHL